MSQAVVHVLELIQIEEQHGEAVAVAAGQANRLGEPVVQQHAVGQIGQEVVLRQVDGLQGHRPRLAHVLEHDHRADHLPAPVVDRGGGVFDGRLEPVAPDEEAVGGQADDSVELNGLVHRVPRGFARRGVNDVEYLGERPAQRLLTRPARHAFGHGVEIRHVARDIGAEHGVADRVEGHLSALLFEEQRLVRRFSLDDPLEGSRQRVAVEAIPVEVVQGSARDGLRGGVFVVRRADDEDRNVRRRLPDLFQGCDPLVVRRAQIEHDRRDPVPAQPFEPIDEPGHVFDDE